MNISDIVQLHTIGYSLHDVKVTFKHDIKIDTPEVSLDTKFNETLNIPRWIAEILELENLVDIHDVDMVSELKQALVKENGQGAFDLSTLSLDFYIKVRSYMKRLPVQNRDTVGSMLNTLIRTRRSKIINFADSLKMTSDHLKKLSIEERIFYNSIHSQSMTFTKEISGDMN